MRGVCDLFGNVDWVGSCYHDGRGVTLVTWELTCNSPGAWRSSATQRLA